MFIVAVAMGELREVVVHHGEHIRSRSLEPGIARLKFQVMMGRRSFGRHEIDLNSLLDTLMDPTALSKYNPHASDGALRLPAVWQDFE